MWNNIVQTYWKDLVDHSVEDIVIQIFSVFFILTVGVIALRIIGKKTISQMTTSNVLFLFVLSATLGALITTPKRILIASIVIIVIVIFAKLIEFLQVKFNPFETFFVGQPVVLYKNMQIQVKEMKKNSVTVDQLETKIREKGYPSIEVCKTIVLEPSGVFSIELLPEFEPIKKIYFDEGIKQILKAIDDSKYVEATVSIKNNLFDEAINKKGKTSYDKSLE